MKPITLDIMIKITSFSTSLSLAAVLLSGALYAESKTADINLSFSHIEYVNLTGTLVGAHAILIWSILYRLVALQDQK